MKFGPHGQVEVVDEFPLLINTAEGPWNRELIDHWAKVIRPSVEAFAARGPWVGIGVMRGSMLCTDEALERHRQIARLLVQSFGGIAAVHVADPGVEGEAMMRKVFEDVFRGICPFAHFHRLEDARAWGLGLLETRQSVAPI